MKEMKETAASGHEGQDLRLDPLVSVEELFVAHAAFTASFLHRLGVPERDVPDLVQEVFLVAHQKGGFRPGKAKARTWIGAIAFRVAGAYRRKKRPTLDPAAGEGVMTSTTPERDAEVRQSLARVQRCLEVLDLDHRATFVLFEIEGMKAAEIATLLDVPEGTVHSRLHHARKRFRAAYDEELRDD